MRFKSLLLSALLISTSIFAFTFVATSNRYVEDWGKSVSKGDTIRTIYYPNDTTGLTLVNYLSGTNPFVYSSTWNMVAAHRDTLSLTTNNVKSISIFTTGLCKIWFNDTTTVPFYIDNGIGYQADVNKTVKRLIIHAVDTLDIVISTFNESKLR